MEKNPVIEFAKVLNHDRKKYPKMQDFYEKAQESYPFSYYFGYDSKDRKEVLKLAEYYNLDINYPISNQNNTGEYKFMVIHHKIVYSKNFFIHFNPLEKISLNRILIDRRKSEWNDPQMFLGNEDISPQSFLMAAKKINTRDLPIEIKIQIGVLSNGYDDDKAIMDDFITKLQQELPDGDTEYYEVGIESRNILQEELIA